MNTVNFLKDKSKLEDVSFNIFKSFYPKNQDILIKIHFGEPGNKTAFFPSDVAPIISALKSLDLRPTFIDTLVAYDSPRNNVAGYEQVVRDKGFDKLAPFIISNHFVEIKTKNFTAHVCQELVEAQNLLVLTHIKGHSCTGFGGTIKNFGMGGLMVESKQEIHNGSKPNFNSETCTGCGTCARLCPFGAIKMVNNRPQIDINACLGCSMCEINCPTKSLTPKVALFDDLLAQGAAACINNLPKNSFYINFIQNITNECDCWNDAGKILAPDKGIIFSDNPIAIDQASLDIVGADVFRQAHPRDPSLQIQYAQEYTKFTNEYELKEI